MSLLTKTHELFNRSSNDVLSINTSALAEAEEYKYNYTKLDSDTAKELRNATCDIRRRSLHLALEVAAIGKRLLEVKNYLDHGEFLEWIDSEFTQQGYFSPSAARNYMNAYLFIEKYKDVKGLLGNIPMGAIYVAARSSVPEVVQEEILDSAKYYKLTRNEVKRLMSLYDANKEEYPEYLQVETQVETQAMPPDKLTTKGKASLPTSLKTPTPVDKGTVTTNNLQYTVEVATNGELFNLSSDPTIKNLVDNSLDLALYQTVLTGASTNTGRAAQLATHSHLSSLKQKLKTTAIGVLIARADTVSTYNIMLNSLGYKIICLSTFRRNARTIISTDSISYGSHILFTILFSTGKVVLDKINDFVNNNKIGAMHYIFETLPDKNSNLTWIVESDQSQEPDDFCFDEEQLKIIKSSYPNLSIIFP